MELPFIYIYIYININSLEATPEKPAPIDWEGYKSKVNATDYVDFLKKQYDALKFEYPADSLSSSISSMEKDALASAATQATAADAKAKTLAGQLASVHAEKSLDSVTVKDFLADKPEWKKEFDTELSQHKYD